MVLQNWTKATVSVLLMTFVFAGVSRADDFSKGSPESTAAIKKAITHWGDVFNRHDAHATAVAYSEDADLTNMLDMTIHGRKEIEQLLQTGFMTRLKNAHRTVAVKRIHFLAPTIAAVDCDFEITGETGADGSNAPPLKGELIFDMSEVEGRWLINIDHSLLVDRSQRTKLEVPGR